MKLQEILAEIEFRTAQTKIEDLQFQQQDKFVKDLNRFVCGQTTVRAGKSTGLAFKYFRAGNKYKNVMMPYIALTRDSARNIMWPILQEFTERMKIPCEFTESDLTCTIKSTGSSIKLFGADSKNFMARIKGIKTPLAAVDECQDFREHLEQLIDILTARTSEYSDGQVCMTGTPGLFPKGFFFEVSNGRHGFTVHHWSLFDNPYFPNAREFVQGLAKRKNWPLDHPTLLREYYGQWVMDLESMVYKYDKEKNHFEETNLKDPIYIMGVDFGFNDADAISVLGWSEKSPTTYLVEELIVPKQGITELVSQIEYIRKRFPVSKIVADFGGLGKKIAEEITRRWQITLVAAEKKEKNAAIELLNDSMRISTFKAREDSRFVSDSRMLKWDTEKSTPERKVVSDRFHSDICDAVLYAFRESPAYAWQPDVVKPKYQTPEWYKQEVEDMEKAAEDHFRAIDETKSEWGW